MKNYISDFKNLLIRKKILFLILFLSFSACITYSFYWQIEPVVDARAYDTIAENIVNHHVYQEKLDIDIRYDVAIARVGPLYEYFLAGVYKIFGHHYSAVWIIQALLHALSAWLIYLICLLVFRQYKDKEKIALWSAGLFGFYPDLIEISAMIMTETLYLFLFCLMLFVFSKYFIKKNIRLAAILGLISGLAVLARPPVLFLIPIIIFYFYRQKIIVAAMVFCAVMLLVFVPWTARNYKIYNEIMPFGAAGAFNFWIGNYHGADGEQGQQPEMLAFVANHEIKELQSKSIAEFKSFLCNYPAEFIKLTLLRINKYFSIIRPMGFWFYQSGWSQLAFLLSSVIASAVLFVFGMGGFIRAFKERNELLPYLLAFTIITPLIIFITVVETRYRFQIYPLLVIFAGYFIIYLRQKPKKWTDKIFLLATAVVFLNGVLDLVLSINRFKERIGWFF